MGYYLKYVVIWFNTREYGGPEEGGWWFDTGEPQKVYTCKSPDERAVCEELANKQVEKQNEGRRLLSSVLSTGRYSVSIEDERPVPYPAVAPHYE